MTSSAHGVARTSSRREGHPAGPAQFENLIMDLGLKFVFLNDSFRMQLLHCFPESRNKSNRHPLPVCIHAMSTDLTHECVPWFNHMCDMTIPSSSCVSSLSRTLNNSALLQFPGSYEIDCVHTTHLVQWLSCIFATQERKKETLQSLNPLPRTLRLHFSPLTPKSAWTHAMSTLLWS